MAKSTSRQDCPGTERSLGRDSITAALQTLAFEPRIAEHTVRLLAKFQGTKVNKWRDEQPGKILHEYRVGELAHLNEIPANTLLWVCGFKSSVSDLGG